MEKVDHRKTASWGSYLEAKRWREQQLKLINRGRFANAMQMDIMDIKKKFGSKYNQGLREMVVESYERNYINAAEKDKLLAMICK
ncbi:hypothetical protein AAEX37_00566 [Oligella sp. MSHR50489EDL]